MAFDSPEVGAVRRHANAARLAPAKAKHARQIFLGNGNETEAETVGTNAKDTSDSGEDQHER